MIYLSDMVCKEIPVTTSSCLLAVGMESSSGHPHELLWSESETSRYFNFIRWLLVKWPASQIQTTTTTSWLIPPSSMWH